MLSSTVSAGMGLSSFAEDVQESDEVVTLAWRCGEVLEMSTGRVMMLAVSTWRVIE